MANSIKLRTSLTLQVTLLYLALLAHCSNSTVVAQDAIPREGLSLWLDAQQLQSSREKLHLPSLSDQQPLDFWPDLSGQGRHFLQNDSKLRPKLVQVDKDWVVRFDGEDDHFRSTAVPSEFTALSLFLVVAPHANPGDFRGFFASNEPDKRDYESGIAVDLGPGPTRSFEQLNVEGTGFGGARDLKQSNQPFGTLHTLEVYVDPASKEVELWSDGKLESKRPFDNRAISMKELTLAARYYTNGPGAHQVRGPLTGDIAEVVLYDRALASQERDSLRALLAKKYEKLAKVLPKNIEISHPGEALVKIENPPAIQMLRAGFEVQELPVELTNINSLRYREDGKLITLGYNGDIHLLSDTDGDGIEDKAELFWKNEGSLRGPIGMVVTPEGYKKGRGIFTPSKGKVSLIVDTNGDDRADQEIVVASGWQEIAQNVDAVGIAMDKEGAVYFGLGTANYANAYLVEPNGEAKFDIRSDRGTVQRISPDLSKRETICTGVRFPIAFDFNERGDLFCSEQEGATWLPNGNPLDELLHIRRDKHFGFPPRHPKYNPNVIDEPSTFDYGPQHQSTCGMFFNRSTIGGPNFGTKHWLGDAIVCGESRGKLWTTKLMKTRDGYVAASELIACLQMLTVDSCLSPSGDLIVACHSGPPDWGTGPAGIGKLFRIRYVGKEEPQPVAIWPEGTNEIRIAFDRPLSPAKMRNMAQGIKVEYGDYVRAGDRFENLVPPYAVVQRQSLAPRRSLPVASVAISNDEQTLILQTASMNNDAYYAVTLPWNTSQPKRDNSNQAPNDKVKPIDQVNEIDLDFALHGVIAEWIAKSAKQPKLRTWLPHVNLTVARSFLSESNSHLEFWNELSKEDGELVLASKLDLHNILRPKVQPGSKIDYDWPAEIVTLQLDANEPILVSVGGKTIASKKEGDRQVLRYETSGDATDWVPIEIRMKTRKGIEPKLEIAVSTNEDNELRPLQLHRFRLPWTQPSGATNEGAGRVNIAELEGGSWGRGRRVFHSEAASCFKCHAVQGIGGRIGPDLSNLIHRDYASVLRDIVNPSFGINPDFTTHQVILKDGNLLTGVLRSENGKLVLGDEKGGGTVLDQNEIESMKPSKVSVMPKGLDEKLTKEQLRDLMTYLLTPPPQMPLDSPLKAPPIRTQAEVSRLLEGAPNPPLETRPLKMVLVAGDKDHGPGEHDYPAWQRGWEQLLAGAKDVEVSTAWNFPSDEQLATADTILFFQKGTWDKSRESKMDPFFARGGGAVYIHWAVNGDEQKDEFAKRIGLASHGGNIRYRHGPLRLDMHHTDHPIMRNLESMDLYDESYWLLTGDTKNVTLLASSVEDGASQPQVWSYLRGKGRVFVSIPGHYNWTFDDPVFRVLLLRGIAWTANEPVDRFNELVPLGARMTR